MRICKKNETKIFKNGNNCIAIEYPLGGEDMNGAVIKLDGRYPDKGCLINTQCKEMVYIMKGDGKIFIDGKEIILHVGDLIMIDPMNKYYWEGNMEMFVSCTPAWTPEQREVIL
jgi:mannose-6-phosphate isomerase-like protein (cupin superfamily)